MLTVGRVHGWHPGRHAIGRAMTVRRRVVAIWRVRHDIALLRRRWHGIAVSSTALALIRVLWKVAARIRALRRTLRERVLAIRLEGVLRIVRVVAKGHQCIGRRLCSTGVAVVARVSHAGVGHARIRHHAGRIAIGGWLGNVIPLLAWMAGRRAWPDWRCIWIVILVLGLFGTVRRMNGLGPWPSP